MVGFKDSQKTTVAAWALALLSAAGFAASDKKALSAAADQPIKTCVNITPITRNDSESKKTAQLAKSFRR